jgi:hypothetical protein
LILVDVGARVSLREVDTCDTEAWTAEISDDNAAETEDWRQLKQDPEVVVVESVECPDQPRWPAKQAVS